MALMPFLAMTAAEMRDVSTFPPQIAWMACHFSPYGLGLTNLPKELPPGSLLIVDDVTPPCRHDPALIGDQLSVCVESFQCSGVLLDFQRAGCGETHNLARRLASTLPCPAAVSEPYAQNLDCPVLLPPVPLSVPLEAHLSPWEGREIWLELGLDGEILTLTEQGCEVATLPCPDWDAEGFADEVLHCHYTIETTEKSAGFTLWRTMNDLADLLVKAEELGIVGAVGLYQELHGFAAHQSLPLEGKVARHSRDG